MEAVVKWPVPRTVGQVREFVGFTQYCRKNVKDFSKIMAPITDITKGNKAFKWTDNAKLAFEKMKVVMCCTPVLKLPEFDKPFEVHTDACILGLGGVLIQEGRPVAYESKKFSEAQQRWTTHEQEMYAVVYCLGRWSHYIRDKHTKV